MRRRYLARIRSWVALANVAAAIGIGLFLGFAIATQLAPSRPTPGSSVTEHGVRRLDFARGVASVAPTGDAVFVRTTTGAALFELDGQILARYQGIVAGFAWLPDGSGVLLREGVPASTPRLPLVVLETDGHVTRLPFDVAEATLRQAHLSADGRWIALQDVPAGVLVTDRDGGNARTVPGRRLLGWDARQRVVVVDGEALAFASLDGSRSTLPLPAALRDIELERLPSRDLVVVASAATSAGRLWHVTDSAMRELPADCLPLWLRPGTLLCAAERAYGLDVATGARRQLAASVSRAARTGARATTEDVLLWVDDAASVHALDLLSGVDRVAAGVPGESAFAAIPGGLFVANDSRDTYVIEARER